MSNFLIAVPVPSMGATVSELNVIVIKAQPGDTVHKGQRLADLESDKSSFEFESPCDGTVRAMHGKPGAMMRSGEVFCEIETADETQRHLAVGAPAAPKLEAAPAAVSASAATPAALIWTPRATKLAQEAGLDPTKLTGIEATGPGNRVSGDDVQRYLAKTKG